MNGEPEFQIGEWITPTWAPPYLTADKPYRVISLQLGIPRVVDDEGDLITAPNTVRSAHLRHRNTQGYWVRYNPPETPA